MHFSRKRQRFLVNQGYSYKVITQLEGLQKEEGILYRTKQEQHRLLVQVRHRWHIRTKFFRGNGHSVGGPIRSSLWLHPKSVKVDVDPDHRLCFSLS